MNQKSNKLLVLDLDETLIHANENRLGIAEGFQFYKYFVHERAADWLPKNLKRKRKKKKRKNIFR